MALFLRGVCLIALAISVFGFSLLPKEMPEFELKPAAQSVPGSTGSIDKALPVDAEGKPELSLAETVESRPSFRDQTFEDALETLKKYIAKYLKEFFGNDEEELMLMVETFQKEFPYEKELTLMVETFQKEYPWSTAWTVDEAKTVLFEAENVEALEAAGELMTAYAGTGFGELSTKTAFEKFKALTDEGYTKDEAFQEYLLDLSERGIDVYKVTKKTIFEELQTKVGDGTAGWSVDMVGVEFQAKRELGTFAQKAQQEVLSQIELGEEAVRYMKSQASTLADQTEQALSSKMAELVKASGKSEEDFMYNYVLEYAQKKVVAKYKVYKNGWSNPDPTGDPDAKPKKFDAWNSEQQDSSSSYQDTEMPVMDEANMDNMENQFMEETAEDESAMLFDEKMSSKATTWVEDNANELAELGIENAEGMSDALEREVTEMVEKVAERIV